MYFENCGSISFTISSGGDYIHMQPTFATRVSAESAEWSR